MANIKYKFDPKTATFKPAQRPVVRYLINIFLFIFSTITFGLLFAYFVFPSLYKADNHLERELAAMEAEYEVMNDKLNETQKVLNNLKERDEKIYRAYFDLDTPEDKKTTPEKEDPLYADFKYGSIMDQTSKKLKLISEEIVSQSKSLDEILAAAKKRESAFNHIPAIQPVANKSLKRVASGYGLRMHPILKVGKMHWGMDYKADPGTPIYATGDAVVEFSGVMGGYGKTVVLNHGYGYKTLYAHMSKRKVTKDQEVKRGDVIGLVGNTGLSSGPHLHYEVHKGTKKVNPITFYSGEISPDELKQLYEESEKTSFSFD